MLRWQKRGKVHHTKVLCRDVEWWVNWRLGIPSISTRIDKRVNFNTRRGFSSIRLGKGWTWMNRDPR